ncbi:MAG: flagellar hook-length control protein FliK [Halioglobus sp.]|nr:flagellar hook-length control protein FliK [Halioglobus sp.]
MGQVLRAQVVDSAAAGGALLNIAGRQVAAATDIFLPQGAWLSLRVTGLVPTPTVRILDAPLRSQEAPTPLERQTLTLLPRQGNVLTPLQALFDPAQRVNILSLLGARGGVIDPALDELLQQGPPRDPQALQKALSQSGLFYESILALRGAQGAPLDLKAVLFRLLARIDRAQGGRQLADAGVAARTLLSSLSRDVEGALATISLNQLTASQYAQQDSIYWVFHVPFRLRDGVYGLSVTLGSEEAGGAGEEEESREWKALLSLELPRLGALEAEVFLREARVSAVIYPERDVARELLGAALPDLQSILEREGFEVGVLRVHAGPRSEAGPVQPFQPGLRRKV